MQTARMAYPDLVKAMIEKMRKIEGDDTKFKVAISWHGVHCTEICVKSDKKSFT